MPYAFYLLFSITLITTTALSETIILGQWSGFAEIVSISELTNKNKTHQCEVKVNFAMGDTELQYDFAQFCTGYNDLRFKAQVNGDGKLVLTEYNGKMNHPSVGIVIGHSINGTMELGFKWKRMQTIKWKAKGKCKNHELSIVAEKTLRFRFTTNPDGSISMQRNYGVDHIPRTGFSKCYDPSQKLVFKQTTALNVVLTKTTAL